MDGKDETKPLKIYSADRQNRKLIGVSSFADLVSKCQEKFNCNGDLRFVLNDDGMEVDTESWSFVTPLASLMMLKNKEVWSPCGENTSKDVLKVMETLRNNKRKAFQASELTSRKKKVPENVKIQPGWQDWSFKANKYQRVRSSKHHILPTGDIILPATSDYNDTLQRLENLFFQNGRSCKGKLSNMNRSLGNSKAEEISTTGFTALSFVNSTETQKPRLYLLTKRKFPDLFSSILTDSESDSEEGSEHTTQGMLQITPQAPVTTMEAQIPTQAPVRTRESQIPTQSPVRTRESQIPTQSPVTPGTPQMLPQATTILRTPEVSTSSYEAPGPSNIQGTFSAAANTPTVRFLLPDNYRQCSVCADREVDAILLPCIHSICFTCGIHLQTNRELCPYCRQQINDVRSIYFN